MTDTKAAMPDPLAPLQRTATVRDIGQSGSISFDDFNSWYTAPEHLQPVFHQARQMRRTVRVTFDRTCTISAADLMPAASVLTVIGQTVRAILHLPARWMIALRYR